MIIGSGLLARGFAPLFAKRDDVCIYAAGVSNSSCVDSSEFERERLRLLAALDSATNVESFLYFSTCSIYDPCAYGTPYVKHKMDMERIVSKHSKHMVIRLSQVAGRTSNPHTLLNYLFAKISRSESFHMWCGTKRNIIDIDDIVAIVSKLISNPLRRNMTINVANSVNYSIMEIVKTMELIVKKKAIYVEEERRGEYAIDVQQIHPLLKQAGVNFNDGYLERVLGKYYGGNS
jgi:nucleoside-diphosphate-sugar epimerase